jgi:predicted anti-sigma-YlaC factor YlaD
MNQQATIVARLLGPAQPELLCDECFEKLDEYVELELSGAEVDQTLPALRAHLEGCEACREEYDSLRELVALRAYLGAP